MVTQVHREKKNFYLLKMLSYQKPNVLLLFEGKFYLFKMSRIASYQGLSYWEFCIIKTFLPIMFS